MLRPPSAQKPYDVFYSGDPAFVLAPREPVADSDGNVTTEDRTAFAKACAEYSRKLELARKTGDWSALLIEGEKPTRFGMRILPSEVRRNLFDRLPRDTAAKLSTEWISLVFRASVIDVSNFGQLTIKREQHPDLGPIASTEISDALDRIDPSIVTELGLVAWERSNDRDPT